MTDLLLVEWLPRGGIPQTTAAWRDTALGAGLTVTVAGRAGDELAPDVAVDRRLPGKAGAAEAHLRLVRRVCREIRDLRPAVVYVQHCWAPLLERRVLEVAREVGARSILAVHNARPHARGAGLRSGFGRLVEAADQVVVHSDHVAGALPRADLLRIDLPELRAVTRAPRQPIDELARSGRRRVAAFGVMRRGYKGRAGLAEVAAALEDGWEVVAAGVGAGGSGPGVLTLDRYLAPGELRWLVESADVVLLPYRDASQSAAVPLAQVLGAPPVASAVGGIPEQISSGRSGVLVPREAGADTWAAAVRSATCVDVEAMRQSAARAGERAAEGWLDLVAAGLAPMSGATRPRGPRSGTG